MLRKITKKMSPIKFMKPAATVTTKGVILSLAPRSAAWAIVPTRRAGEPQERSEEYWLWVNDRQVKQGR